MGLAFGENWSVMIKILGGFVLGMAVATYLGLDLKSYTPERGQRLVNILKGKSS